METVFLFSSLFALLLTYVAYCAIMVFGMPDVWKNTSHIQSFLKFNINTIQQPCSQFLDSFEKHLLKHVNQTAEKDGVD